MGTSSAPSPPKPSAAEQSAQAANAALLNEARRLLEQQTAASNVAQPYLYKQLGLKPIYTQKPPEISGAELQSLLGLRGKKAAKSGIDAGTFYSLESALGWAGENTNQAQKIQSRFEQLQPTQVLSGLESIQSPQTELEQRLADQARQIQEVTQQQTLSQLQSPEAKAAQANAAEILALSQAREKAALKGELPLNPGLLSDLDKQLAQTQQSLQKQLGPGWQTSSAGIESIRQYNLMRNTVLDAARRGDLTLADALQSNAMNQARGGLTLNDALYGSQLGNLLGQQSQQMGLTGTVTQFPYGNIGGYGQTAAGYGQMAAMLGAQRMNSYNQQLAAMNSGQNTFGSIFGPMASMAGMLGSAYMMSSSKDFKNIERELTEEEITDVIEAVSILPIYKWRYKGEDVPHFGPVTEEMPQEMVTQDGKSIDLLSAIGLLLGAVKHLQARVARLEA